MKLIINADDFGVSKSVNNAIIELAMLGSVTSTTVMVNMPFASQILALTRNNNISIGLHFNLTDGKPVSEPKQVQSLISKKTGLFLSHTDFLKKARFGMINKGEIIEELQAQIRLFNDLTGNMPAHIDSHQNIHKRTIIARALIEFGKQTKIPGLRNPMAFYIGHNNTIHSHSGFTLNSKPLKFLRNKLAGLYIKKLASRYRKIFKCPDGELHYITRKKLDFLTWMIHCESLPFTDKVFEVPCHPALSTEGVENSKLSDKRVSEYEILRSEAFLKAISKFKLLTFKDL